MDAYKKLNKNEFNSLSDTALDFFHFVQSFGIKLKILDFVNPWLLEDQIQDLDTVTSGVFHIYFDDNLFNPGENNKIQNKRKTKKNNCRNFAERTICFKRPKQKRRNNTNRTISARKNITVTWHDDSTHLYQSRQC